MIPQQSSNFDTDHNPKLSMINQMYQLRKENDRLRKQISKNLHLVFSTLKETSNQDLILKNQKQIIHYLSQDYTQKLLAALTFCYEQTQFMISESGQFSKEVNQSIDEKKKKLQEIKNQIMTKENSILQINESIQNKATSIDTLEQELQTLINQYMQLRIKYIEKKHSQSSDEKVNQNHLVQQWDKQKRYIITLIQQRAQIRKKISIIQNAHEMLDHKINDEQKKLEFFLQKKQKNNLLSQQNAKLLDALNSQKERKSYLEDSKMIQVLKKQVSLSADIVQKWDETKKTAENNLLSIIQKINKKLPARKLQDLTQIINAAQRFYNLPKDSERIYQEQEKIVENQEELNIN